ncbi:MAG: Gfo/Idh/MocA family oxidoreductase [Lentisphaeria bacterium]|nr:Gfo/Idh/MocA family oxidoreductase [Lentisphaeria bacterium]
MSKKVKLAIVGLGWGYNYHIQRVREVPEAELVAVADVSADRLAKAKAEYDIPKTYTDANDLFEHADVDGVIIAVPNFLHRDFAVKAMECGKHVCLEKPIAPTVAQARDIAAARDRTGRIFMANFNQRFAPEIRYLKHLSESGRFGDFLYGKTEWTRFRGIPWGASDWFVQHEKSGGGPLIDIGVHRLDLALFLMNFPKVKAVTGNVFRGQSQKLAEKRGTVYDVEDAVSAYIQFENNAALMLEASWYLNKPNADQNTEIYGTKGGFRLGGGGKDAVRICQMESGDAYIDVNLINYDKDLPRHNIEHFVRVLAGREELLCTAEQAITGMEIIEAIYKSGETGKTVVFD